MAKSILKILPIPPARIFQGEIFIKGEDILKMGQNEIRSLDRNGDFLLTRHDEK
ncbi:MAG: hypothetical protein GY792_03010 [Gammaproteobacteria bacterium]|nr:hypothetical protein [Gammaproteobacteria bacterium]